MGLMMLNESVSVRRLADKAGVSGASQRAVVASAIPCMIQPLDSENQATYALAAGRGFKAFFDIDANVQIGDELTDTSGRVFGIKGIRRRDYGRIPHMDAVLEQAIKSNQQ